MPDEPHSSHREPLSSGTRKGLLVFGLVLIYAVVFLLQFLSDPLAQAPVLDARENLVWAERIASLDLPPEPFYRALLYPLLVSFLPNPQILAPVLGVLCHLLSALLCGLIAFQIWKKPAAAWFSCLFYGVYPVSLFFAVQILDITFALTLFLFGVWALMRLRQAPRYGLAMMAGVAGGLAVLARPNFLPAVLCFPLIAFGLTYLRNGKSIGAGKIGFALLLPMAGLLLLQGLVNFQLGGEFRVLPWQGSYNLYAANSEGANGKFYKQTLSFDSIPAGMNTTRMESEYLYREAVGAEAPMEVDAMGSYWRSQLLESIYREPFRWLGLMGRKVFYVVSDWEQYNNLTYAYHKERFPALAWNPLGWGLLLIGAVVALALMWERLSKPELAGLGLIGLAYAAGLLLFFVSARFRLPLAPLVCVFCGGLSGLSWGFARQHGMRCLVTAGLVVGGAVLSYGDWFDARNSETFIQDEILLANAALQSGRDLTALEYASKALARDEQRQDARRLQVSALFNLWLVAEGHSAVELWQALGKSLAKLRNGDAATRFIEGVFYWKEGDRASARSAWRTAVQRYGEKADSSAAALEWINASPGEPLSPQARQIGGLLEWAEAE